MSGIKVYARRLRYEARCIIAGTPSIYLPLARLKQVDALGATAVGRGSELVIEAFPRSGNTFAVFAFLMAQDLSIRLAHHLHAPAQLHAAARLGVPALLIVREPADAVCSFVQRESMILPGQALRNWCRFHEQVLPAADSMVIATFEQVTDDFGRVIERVNNRFGSAFKPFLHTQDNVDECFRRIESRNAQRFGRGSRWLETGVARPSEHRRASRARIMEALDSVTLRPRLARARAFYQQFADIANEGASEAHQASGVLADE